MKIIGGQEMVSSIKKILVRHSLQAFKNDLKIKKEYATINYFKVPDSKCESLGYNVLTVESKKVIMVDGSPKTKCRIKKRGLHNFVYDESEISLKSANGSTCLTKPFFRSTSY